MKKIRSRLAMILMLMLIFTSLEIVGVFAEGDDGNGAPATVNEMQDAEEDVAPAEDADAAAPADEAVQPEEEALDAPAITNQGDDDEGDPGDDPEDPPVVVDPTITGVTANKIGLAAYSSYNAVVLEWNKASVKVAYSDGKSVTVPEGAEGFTVKYSVKVGNGAYTDLTGKLTEVTATDKNCNVVKDSAGNAKKRWQYTVTGLKPGEATNSGNKTFYVKTEITYVDEVGETHEFAFEESKTDAPVRTIAYRIKIKASGTLQSHGIVSGSGAKRKSFKVTKGQTLYVDRYGAGGKYIFTRNNNIYYCNLTRSTKQTAVYVGKGKWNYSKKEAQFFVNRKGLTSKKNTLVWINTYTQHIYIFTGSKGKWKCQDHWECSTGKAKTPTPTGITGKKTIFKKIAKRHSIPYWSSFSDINSIHGRKYASWEKLFGSPASNGCVRNPNAKAQVVYKKYAIGTAVFVY